MTAGGLWNPELDRLGGDVPTKKGGGGKGERGGGGGEGEGGEEGILAAAASAAVRAATSLHGTSAVTFCRRNIVTLLGKLKAYTAELRFPATGRGSCCAAADALPAGKGASSTNDTL
jgi:hypothetical protein